jgi:hypothetical protein
LQTFGRIALPYRKLDKIHINDTPPFGSHSILPESSSIAVVMVVIAMLNANRCARTWEVSG